jgi:hypothetical protein
MKLFGNVTSTSPWQETASCFVTFRTLIQARVADHCTGCAFETCNVASVLRDHPGIVPMLSILGGFYCLGRTVAMVMRQHAPCQVK